MKNIVHKNKLYKPIKKVNKERLAFNFYLKNIPYVSKEEMEDIEKLYGKPKNKDVAYSEIIEI